MAFPKNCLPWTLVASIILLTVPAFSQDLAAFEKAVTEFTLDNGLHFIVLERHDAPVISFHTYANVGSADDPSGQTGIAHMFEHMAFKGTPEIGSKNYADEKKALEAVDRAHEGLQQERRKGPLADEARLEELEKNFRAAVEKAAEHARSDEYTRIIEENGGTGLNAGTSLDETMYFSRFPSNRTELFFYLESERFLNPVFRDFYKERDVVREERRMRTESNPIGRLVEAFLAAAYQAHPYGRPGVGWPSDIQGLSVEEAKSFFESYYGPSNLIIAIAGDVDPTQIRKMAKTYFGRLPRRDPPPAVRTEEPEQRGERRVEVISDSQPAVVIGYKKPSRHHPDRAVFDVISSILSSGRTSWLYKDLVRDRQIALFAGGFPNFPGSKYTSLFLFFAFPSVNHTVEENEKAMYEVIERLKSEKVETETLEMVKAKARADLIRRLDNATGLAAALAVNHAAYGDWRQMFRQLDEVRRVTADDVQRVAKEYFRRENRTVTYSVKPSLEGESSAGE